jgi:hypothetical protein
LSDCAAVAVGKPIDVNILARVGMAKQTSPISDLIIEVYYGKILCDYNSTSTDLQPFVDSI